MSHRRQKDAPETFRDRNHEMPRQLISSDRLTHAAPYHYMAAVTGATIVFSAGACPLDGDGRVVAAGDITGQTRQSIENLRIALQDAGCTQADVVKTTIFVASSSRDDLRLAWNEYESAYGTDGPPSTLLGVAALGWPEQLVEIEAIAVRG
jgi:enamine deaminase RidA (YjgF/YER057c/UK114 family)